MFRLPCVLIAMLLALFSSGASQASEPQPIQEAGDYPLLSGVDSLKSIEVAAGFQVELVAAEPLVFDPVAFDWGPDGKLWVVEMADYPFHEDGSTRPGGRIRVLEDVDRDGVYDRATLFAENLSTPTGILTWRKGVLVTASPDVLYLEDTTGDGKSDRVEKLYSGFGEGNQQHRVNGLCWGLDNWVYLANGDSGGKVVSHKTGKIVDIRGRDLRIRPDTGELETQAGQTQFGRNRDDWGNWFSCNNPNPIFHFVLEEHYLRRNPHLVPPVVKKNILVGDTLVFPIGPIVSHCDPKYRPIGATPRFTSACGTIVYRDTLFGPEYRDVTFTSEPVYNIVHARKLTPAGVTFASEKLQGATEEFFRSSDPWSRPTMLQTGPDGALYIADMVREVIEHPEWIDDEFEKTIDVHAGVQHGRIYRVIPQGTSRRPVPDFSRLNTLALVDILNSPNGWQRDLAQRMLIWKNDDLAVPALRNLVSSATSERTRLQALCTLDGMQSLEAEVVRAALRDQHPEVRRQAIRLSEGRYADTENWREAYRSLLDGDSAFVHLQLAYTLGEVDTAWSADLLADLTLKIQEDPILVTAALSSLGQKNVGTVLRRLTSEERASPLLIGKVTACATRYRETGAVANLLETISWNLRTMQLLREWFQGMGADSQQLEKFLNSASLSRLDSLLREGKASLRQLSLEERAATLRLLGRRAEQRNDDVQLLESFIEPQQPISLQLAAVRTLSETGLPTVPRLLTSNWESHGPTLRSEILETLLARPAWTRELLSLLEQKIVPVSSLAPAHRNQLQAHRDRGISEWANRLLGAVSSNRNQVLMQFAQAVQLAQDNARDLSAGREVFGKKCAACHRLDQQGHAVGPDLTRLVNRAPDALLTAIIDPNRAVEAKYLQDQIVTTDGRVLAGLLTEETTNSVTLTGAEGKTVTLPREAIEILKGSSLSMMPDGLEQELTLGQMADLIHYVVNHTAQ